MVNRDENVGLAFALVTGAGLATAVGAMVVFFPQLVKYATRKTLAAALAVSAGVMIYVSFAEIFLKSVESFVEAGADDDRAMIYATLCFFGGVGLMVILNKVVERLVGPHHHHNVHHHTSESTSVVEKVSEDAHICLSHDENPVAKLEDIHQMALNLQNNTDTHNDEERRNDEENGIAANIDHDDGVDSCSDNVNRNGHDSAIENENGNETLVQTTKDHKLIRMSVNTAVAIALHNFPEGLATFVATLADPSVGFVLAIAIAIHNIPEGVCVAMPVFYGTGSRWKAFGWAFLSGVSEPLAAFLGWIVLANSFSDNIYAILFGIVAGMMVIISIRELLPTAHRYDPEDQVTTTSFIAGMAVMALSLVLFLI